MGLAYAALNAAVWKEVADAFRSFPTALALLSLLPLVGAMLLRALRWHVLLDREPVTFRQVFLVQNTGIGLNNMLPIRMVSEPVQLALINRRYGVPLPKALATLVAGNVFDIFASAMLMTLGVALSPGLRDGKVGIQMGGAVVMVVVSLLVFIAVSRGIGALPVFNRMRFFQRLAAAVGTLRDKPARLWASFLATLSSWLLLGVAGWLLGTGFDLGIGPLTMATILVAATFFTSAVPSLPAGAGTYHFAVVSLLTALGVNVATAFTFAVAVHVLVMLPPALIALGMLWGVGASILPWKREADEGALAPASDGPA